jgi:hypothetical protein
MKKFLDLKSLLILGLIAVIVFMRACSGVSDGEKEIIKVDGKDYELLKHTVDTVEVEKTKVVTKKGDDIYHEIIVEKEVIVPAVIDTAALLKDYYSKVLYKDVLVLPDSLGTVAVIDTISQNRILGRTFDAKVKEKTIYDTKIVKELPKNQLYIGGGVGFDKVNFLNGAKAGVIYKTKSDKMFGLDLGVTNNVLNPTTGQSALTPYIGGSMYWKIKFGK